MDFKPALFCPSCGNLIPVRFINSPFNILSYCNKENKEIKVPLINKYSTRWNKEFVPFNWPKAKLRWNIKSIYWEDIINWTEIPCFLFYISNSCNMNCKICYQKDKSKLPLFNFNKFKDFLNRLKNKRKFIILFGGEPTLNKQLPEIIYVTNKSGNFPILFTNGLKLTDKYFVNILKDVGLKFIFFSFDGFNPSIYKILRGDRSDFYKKLRALDNMKEAGFRVTSHTTIAKDINFEQIPIILDFIGKNDFVCGVNFKPIYTDYIDQAEIFRRNHSMSIGIEEIMQGIGEYFHADKSIFYKYDYVRQELVKILVKANIRFRLPVFQFGVIYALRKKNKLHLGMDECSLEEIIRILKNHLYWKVLANPELLRWGIYLFLKKINNNFLDVFIRKEGIVSIATSVVTKKFDTVFSYPYSWPITMLEFHTQDLSNEVFPIVDATPY